jgi:ABC-2 type transport system ATP-binding protein
LRVINTELVTRNSEQPGLRMDSAIKAIGLTKVFGDTVAVDHIDLDVRKGELFGLVGPDGAGKTSMMRLLVGIMEPTSGEAWVAGLSVMTERERVKERIGYMSQRFGLYEDLTVIENIRFYADLYGVSRRERLQATERLLGFSNLTPFQKRLAGQLSGGMKQKLGLACALVHRPEVLFLDEPTNGVDPVARRDFWKILYELLRDGITIFVSTAYLDEAERCGRVGLMYQGRLLTVDEPGRVRASTKLPMVEMWFADARAAAEVVRGLPGVRSTAIHGDRLHLLMEEGNIIDGVHAALKRAGIGVKGERERLPSLEDVFISMVEVR